jgi:predicted N-formylglutamate amidohydrolase
MTEIADLLPGKAGADILLIADHAANRVPPDLDLGIPADLLHAHVAIDIGVDPLARQLSERIGCAAVIARHSRLVVDLNRDPEDAALIPAVSDGHVIAGNQGLDAAGRNARIAAFWQPYHRCIDDMIDALRPRLLLSLHSFTPQLASRPEEQRPWQIGVLYNQDERAARLAIPQLEALGIVTGDNQPYSGRVLNVTMNRHGEARGLPYLGLEVRQDLIADDAGVRRWCEYLAPVILATTARLPEADQYGRSAG